MKQNQTIKIFILVAATALATLATACSPKIDNGGYVQEGAIKDQITVGQSTREDVRTKLGSPSSQSSFGDEAWYYITNKKEAIAFLKPEITEQNVVEIQFDNKGVVSKVENYNKDNGKEFDLVKRTTPTEGHTLGFIEQVLGNIGRFNHPGNETSNQHGAPPGGGR